MVCSADSVYMTFVLTMLSCSLSLIFSILVIFFIIKKSLFQAHSYKILTYISVNDLLRSLIGMLEFLIDTNSIACSLYGYLDFYFFASNAVWAFCLTFTIFQIIVLEETSFEKYHKIWVFVTIFVIGGVDALPFLTQSYGFYGGFCQMASDDIGNIWRFSIIYIPLSIGFAATFVLFVKIFRKIKSLGNISIRMIVLDRGIVYILVILVVFIPFLIVRVVELFENNCNLDSFTACLMFLYNLQGCLNGFVFFYNKSIRSIIFQKNDGIFNTAQSGVNSLQISFVSVLIN